MGWCRSAAINSNSDDDDASTLVEQTARKLVQQHGARAADFARERAQAADELDDFLAAKTWRDIADAIDRL